MHQYGFEKLRVWQKSRELTKHIYLITKNYPAEEKFGLVSQMRRSAISISSNIAEGSSRKSTKDQSHFYTMSYSSAMELLNQIILSLDLKFINNAIYEENRKQIESITNQINALQKSIASVSNN